MVKFKSGLIAGALNVALDLHSTMVKFKFIPVIAEILGMEDLHSTMVKFKCFIGELAFAKCK